MLKNLTVIGVKTEVTYNTDPVPTGAANAMLVENMEWSFDSARLYERNPIRSSLAPLKPLYGGTLMSVKFDVEIKGSGTAGTAPEIGPLLTACGMSETVVAVTSVTYKPSSTVSTHKSVTIYIWQDGTLIKMTGCRGTVSGSGEVGQAGKLSFMFVGHFVSRTDVAIATPTYNAQVPPILLSIAFVVDSYSAVITKLGWDMGIELAKPGNIAAADGYGEIRIADRKLSGSFDPEQTVVATYNWITKWQTGAAAALDSGLAGTVAGNRWKVTMPAVTYVDLSNGDKTGLLTHEVKFQGMESSGDDEMSLAFT